MNQVSALCSALLLLLLGLSGCATNCGLEPEPCESQNLSVSSLEAEYGCTSTRWLGLSGGTAPVVIRTQAAFDQQVSGQCHPQIDFARFDLIIGQQPQLGGAASASATYTYRRNCSPQERTLQVELKSGVTYDLATYTYHALVPKLAPTETVRVVVEVTP